MEDKYRVLYYPHFQPNPRWLLKILLLTDQVERIVPEDADTEDSDRIKELIQEIPGALVSESPKNLDIEFDALTMSRLKQAFRFIRERSFPEAKRQFELRFGQGGTLAIDGHVFLHHAKVAPRVRDLLIEEGLLLPSLEEITKSIGAEKVHPVPEQASNLILSCIADRIAKREGLDTVTDKELDFATTSLDSFGVAVGCPEGCVEGSLLSAIATVSIPQEVDELGIQTYKDLRESYSPIREAFKEYVMHVAAVNRLARIEDRNVLSERTAAAAERIRDESEKYSHTTYARRFKRWIPFAICSMLSVGASFAEPAYVLAFAVGTVSLELLKKVFIERTSETQTPEACRLLADMRRDILRRAIDALA